MDVGREPGGERGVFVEGHENAFFITCDAAERICVVVKTDRVTIGKNEIQIFKALVIAPLDILVRNAVASVADTIANAHFRCLW